MQDALLRLLNARDGHFKLESGHHGNLWLDLDQLLLRAGQVRRFARELAERLAPYHVAAICGPLLGGALLAQTIAAELDLEFYYTERFVKAASATLFPAQYHIPASLRPHLHGKRIAVVDDVINAGSAMRGTMTELQIHRAQPIVVGALLVLGSTVPEDLRAQKVPLESLGYLPSDLWLPDQCPLCAAQVPLEDLTTG